MTTTSSTATWASSRISTAARSSSGTSRIPTARSTSLRGNDLDLAYAVTVHKSQSEWPIIIMPIHKNFGNRLPQRNLLYTAVTRAKQLLILVGDRDEIPKIVRRNEQGRRFTNLAELLNGKSS